MVEGFELWVSPTVSIVVPFIGYLTCHHRILSVKLGAEIRKWLLSQSVCCGEPEPQTLNPKPSTLNSKL